MNFSDAFKEILGVVEHLVRTHEIWNGNLSKDSALEKVQTVAKMVDDVVDPIADAPIDNATEVTSQ